ncbi:MAG: hypothetical protein U0797_20320 [Gemmataceae bacterium]
MTRRERVLATTTLVLMAVLGSAAGFHFFVYEPYSEANSQLLSAQEQLSKKRTELAQEEDQIKGVLRVNPRLSQWHKISLPPRDPEGKKLGVSPEEQKRGHQAKLQVDYERYLSELMRASGFRGDSIVISHATPDTKTKLNTPKGKEPTFERLAFGVTGKGNKDAVVKMLATFHKEPLLHQVRKLSVSTATNPGGSAAGGGRRGGAAGEGLLDVNMTVEALLVQGAEERATLKPAPLSYPPRVLAEPGRDYQTLARRNMFTGVAPPRVETPARTTEDRADVLRFVKLTTLYYDPERDRWEGTFYDQAAGPVRVDEQDEDGNTIQKVKWERKVNTRLLSELKVPDKYGNMLLDAKVVHIDERQLIFKVDNSFFRLRCGDALYPAIDQPLGGDDVKELGLGE